MQKRSSIDDTEVLYFNDPVHDEELKCKLKLYETKISQLYDEIGQFYELRGQVCRMLKAKQYRVSSQTSSCVHFGMNFYTQIYPVGPEKLSINIGLNHYLEFSMEEAMSYVHEKIHHLEELAQHYRDETAKIRSMARYGPLDTWHVTPSSN